MQRATLTNAQSAWNRCAGGMAAPVMHGLVHRTALAAWRAAFYVNVL